MFLFIIPPDWNQVTGEALDMLDVNRVINLIAGANYNDLTELMREQGLISADDSVQEARVFEGEVLAYRK